MSRGSGYRILLAADSLDVGGAERHVVALAIALHQVGHAVAVACSAGGPVKPELEAHDIPVHILARSLVKRRLSVHFGWRLRERVHSGQFELVHAHMYAASAAAALAIAGTGIPLILTEHSGAQWRGPVARFISRALYRRARAIIAVSPSIGRRLVAEDRALSDRIMVIPNAIPGARREDPHPPAPVTQLGASPNWVLSAMGEREMGASHPLTLVTQLGAPLRGRGGIGQKRATSSSVVGMIARLHPEKGVYVFLEAAARLAAMFPACRFVVAGNGPLRAELGTHAARLQLGGRLTFLGTIPSAQFLLPYLDLLVVPSLSEGSPLVVLEGMAAGVPIVASHVGGIPDQIRHEKEGLLVPPGDARALATACALLVRDPDYAGRLGRAAQMRVQQCFSHAVMVRETEKIYERVLKRAAIPAGVAASGTPHAYDAGVRT